MTRQTMTRWLLLATLAALPACAPVASTTPLTMFSTGETVAPIALVGSTPAILNAEFGQPVLRRVDGTSQVWLYHSSVCGLNLILFPDRAGTPRVATAVPDNNDPASCTASLQRGRLVQAATLEPPAAS